MLSVECVGSRVWGVKFSGMLAPDGREVVGAGAGVDARLIDLRFYRCFHLPPEQRILRVGTWVLMEGGSGGGWSGSGLGLSLSRKISFNF